MKREIRKNLNAFVLRIGKTELEKNQYVLCAYYGFRRCNGSGNQDDLF